MSQTTDQGITSTAEPSSDAQRLKNFKNAYITAASAIDKLKEPLIELIEIKDFLLAVQKEGLMAEADWAKFVNEDIGPGMAKRLAKERSYQENYLTAVAEVMEALIIVFLGELRAKRYNESFIAGMTFLFQPDSMIHKSHYQIPQETLKKLRTANQNWRTELKVGDQVDVLIKADEKGVLSGFMQAKIVRVEQDLLFLNFPESSNFYDCQMDRWATEICPFESKTKEDYTWRREHLAECKDLEVDAHDKSSWLKATIFETKNQTISQDRVIKLAYVAFRVYRQKTNSIRKDERGTFDGWSQKFDEWIPVFSPRILPWQTRVGVANVEDDDNDAEIDDLVEPEPGMKRVYAVPRIFKCISGQFLHFMNLFGNEGGFDMVIDILENSKLIENGDLTISVMGCLAQIVTLPAVVLHKDFIAEFGERISAAIKNRILSASDKSLRDIRKDQLDTILKSIDNISRRFLSKEEREKQSEILKLQTCNKSLNSEFLERRINAIKDLNSIIRNNTLLMSSKVFTTEFLIEWMKTHDVFSTIWDFRKTHIQLVQRSNEIFKLLCKEDLMSEDLLNLFWNLTNTHAYKAEVFKIINEAAIHLRNNHIYFFFTQITATKADNLSMEEFNALSELGKYCKNSEFMHKVSDFFWKIITEATHHTDELIENCIKKFTEMVQYWTVEQKLPLFESLTDQLKVTDHPALPVIRLFTKMIKDQKERVTYTSAATTATYSNEYAVSTYPIKNETGGTQESIYDCGADSTTTTVATTPSNDPEATEITTQSDPVSKDIKELSFDDLCNTLQTKKGLVQILLNNLEVYCNRVVSKVTAEPALLKLERTKLFIQSKSASHAEEVSERLQFLNYYASISDFVISKTELRVIYDLLARSPVKSDLTEFLIWCKQACIDSSSNFQTVLNLEEVGEFYSHLIASGSLDVKTLPLVGFEFLQHYFISVNENQSKLLKIKKEKPKSQTNYTQGAAWKSYFLKNTNEEVAVKEDNDPSFKIVINPSQLEKLDLIWTVVLSSQNDEVVPKAVNFLIKTYMCLDECLSDDAAQIQHNLIEKCMSLIKDQSENSHIVKRVLLILKNIIKESEKRGTGGVQPHNAILKGELLDRIIIKNYTMSKAQNLVISVYTSATVWEFVREVSKMLWLTPKHVEFKLPNGQIIDESMNGMVLSQLNFKQGDIIIARKIQIEEEVVTTQFVDTKTRQFTPAAQAVFEEWWEVYKDENSDFFTPVSATRFIKGCTYEEIGPTDERITNLFSAYDKEKKGVMSKAQFMDFFLKACIDRIDRVIENLKCHNIRADLLKIIETRDDNELSKEQMPRYTMSANQHHFNVLIDVLEKNKDAQADAWDLIRMLATNQEMYREVLTLKNAKDSETGIINWSNFFENSSVYKQIYNFEIIEAVMKEGEKQNAEEVGDNRVFFVEYQDTGSKKSKAGWLPPQLKYKQEFKKEESTEADRFSFQTMKNNWTKQFVEQNGIQFVLNRLLSHEVGKNTNAISRNFELKNISFMLTLLRVFIVAAISAQPNSEISGTMSLLRRKSSLHQVEESKEKEKPQQEANAQIIELLKDHEGLELLLSINFSALQTQLLNMVASVLQQESASIEEKQIVESAMSLWVGILSYQQDQFDEFEKYNHAGKNAEDLVMHGVLYCKEEKIREDFRMAFSAISHTLKAGKVLSFFIRILSANFSKISDFPCVQFFDLYNELIDLYYSRQSLNQISAEDQNIFDPESVLSFIIDKIRSNKFENGTDQEADEEDVFAREKSELNEKFRVGLITLLAKIISKVDAQLSEKIVQKKGLIQEIFKEFLFSSVFASGGNQSVIAKLSEKKQKKKVQTTQNNKSREAAYQLLLSLIKQSPVLMGNFINDQLMPLLEMINKPNKWNYQPPGQSSVVQKFVGLRNLGCICYMNSMLQQFFMTPAFRYNILCVDDGIQPDMQEYKGDVYDDNMLHQLQRLIAHLELSERQDYNPKGFCFSFKEMEGGPTNISEQKDAQEFLNILFDRLENALKPTSRKYLLQNIFGGKQISQMVCQECGKVRNRVEDFYAQTLTVKDIKSVHDSFKKQVEGEIINDYSCDACGRKVDLSKRTLIAETPNILIVHNQRLVFNFDTFRNDKINTFFKFPEVLDLTPYSYYDVMRREGRLKEKTEGDQEEEQDETVKNDDEDNIEPIQDDCFEYKLVGVNVHSGSAQAGHYWSYINTKRDSDEGENDPNWIKTEADPWMEFNDSRVSEWQFKNLESECFGEDTANAKAWQSAGWSYSSGSYGKSGYMLFYERRKKKPLKILVPESQVEEAKAQGVVIHKDEKTNEFYKLVGYREGAENEKPSEIYQKVFEDNQSVTFENDIYSLEFFDFIKQILEKVASYADQPQGHELNVASMKVAKKVVIDILSRCFANGGMKLMVQIMIDIFKKDDRLCKQFVTSLLEENNAECILELLFECTDKVSQANAARLIKYLLCRLKVIEKEELLSGAVETVTEKVIENGEEINKPVQIPKAVCAKLMNVLLYHLFGRAARSWSRFDYYLDVLKSFGLNSAEEIEKDLTGESEAWDHNSEASKIGLQFYFSQNIIERFLDFILGDASPIKHPGDKRVQMGSSFVAANFSPLIKLVTAMMTEKELLAKYPLSEATRSMISSKEMLSKMIDPTSSSSVSTKEFILMCQDNLAMSKKVANLLIKGINQYQVDKVTKFLKLLKKFLSIDDEHKLARLEWTLGVPEIVNKKQFRKNTYQYGLELVNAINDEAHTYNTCLNTGTSEDALLTQLLKIRKQQESICMLGLKCLLKLCVNDEVIARYVYNCAPHSYQHARYTDWFKGYFYAHRAELEKATASGTSSYSAYYENRLNVLGKADVLLTKFEEICKKFAEEDKAKVDALTETSFVGLRDTWMAYDHPEVIPHFPPQLIIGKQVGEERVLHQEENESVIVKLVECDCEWIYSNPTGIFNLSLPDKTLRMPNYTVTSYEQFKKYQSKKEEPQEQAGDDAEQPEGSQEPELVVKDWIRDHRSGFIVLKVVCISKLPSMFNCKVNIEVADNENKNIRVPLTGFSSSVFGAEEKAIGHLIKIDPSKEAWGDFKLSITVKKKYGQTSQISTSSSYSNVYSTTNAYATTASYSNIGISTETDPETYYEPARSAAVSYVPNYGNTDVKIACNKCGNLCDYGQDYCEKCGESTKDDTEYNQYFQS